MRAKLLFAALAVFVVLHQDAWLWDDATLVLGFLPAGLAYHAAYSLATAVLWALVVRHAWPKGLEPGSGPPDEEGGRAR